jgi:hypothetical protein
MQPTELVDLVLVFSADLDLVTASGSLVFFRKLRMQLVSTYLVL